MSPTLRSRLPAGENETVSGPGKEEIPAEGPSMGPVAAEGSPYPAAGDG